MSVKQYLLKFTQFVRYAPNMMADSRAHLSKFVCGVSKDEVKEYSMTTFIKEINLSRLKFHAQQIQKENIKEKEIENTKTLSPELVLIVNKFVDMFLKDLFGFPPERKIDFKIDILIDTHLILILSSRMALSCPRIEMTTKKPPR